MSKFVGLIVLLLAPAIVHAQGVVSPVRVRFDVVAVGGFLGQLDGFCEQPGGTYDLNFIRKTPLVQSCADHNGALRKGEWPVALGGLLGAQTHIETINAGGESPLVVVQGNNQVANFTFLSKQQLLDSKANYVSSPEPLLLSGTRNQQTETRFRRFWQELAALKPAAIGLGTEDFVRSLRDPLDRRADPKDRATIFQRWIHLVTTQGLPLIGSNAVIKTRGDDGSVEEDDDFSLTGITKDQTTGWLTEVKVSHPKRAGIVLSLWEKHPTDNYQKIGSKTTDGSSESTTLDPDNGTLFPGRRYEVRVREGSESFTLRFKTHHALTPLYGNTKLNGFPVVEAHLADNSGSMLILSLVDPAVKKVIGADAWKWKRRNCDAATIATNGCEWDAHLCPDEHCEIDFMAPADAVKAAIVRALAEQKPATPGEKPAPTPRKPLILLLSSLTDAQNQELLEAFPEIRIIVLDPDSDMLGRASQVLSKEDKALEKRRGTRIDEKQEYSGDRGLFAMYNWDRPPATMLAARPEWIGESVARFKGSLTYSTAPEWEIDQASITVTPIPGAALQWAAAPCPAAAAPAPGAPPPPIPSRPRECTEFFVTWPDPQTRITYGPFPSYEVCEAPKPLATDIDLADRCTMMASLKDKAEFSAFAGDTLRRATGSELAVVPGLLMDPDAQAWLLPLIDKQHTRILTRFILERAIFRSFRIVRAIVAGDKLLDTLDKALKSANYVGSCVVGLATKCAGSVDTKATDTARVNARVIHPQSFYTIAMPEGLAEELALSHSEGNWYTTDAVSALHQRLNTYDNGWYMPDRDNTMSLRIEKRANRKLQHNLLTTVVEYSYQGTDPKRKPDGESTLDALDVGFRGATKTESHAGKLKADWAVFDWQHFAIRGLTELDFSEKADFEKTDREAIFEIRTTYPSNTWLAGGRADWKHDVFGRELRVFGGYFVDREFRGPRKYLTAGTTKPKDADGFTPSLKASKPTLYLRKPLEFTYAAAGVDYLNVKKFGIPATGVWLDISRATFEYANGRLYHVPIGARIDGVDQMFDQPDGTVLDAQGILNAYFARNPSTFDNALNLEAVNDTPRRQKRIQAEANLERTFAPGSHKFKTSAEIRYRHFPRTTDSEDNSLKNYWRTKLAFTYTLASRIEVGPVVEWHHATVMVPTTDEGPFTYRKVELKVKFPFVVRAGWGWLWR